MDVTDKRIIEIFEKYPGSELEERVGMWGEEDLDEGETWLDAVISEAEHLEELYHDGSFGEDLKYAREVLRDIKNGFNLVMDFKTMQIKDRHSKSEVAWAEREIQNYNNLKKMIRAFKKLKEKEKVAE